MKDLADRVAVVTGGGGGIGEALALACAGAGMHVAVADIEGDKADKVAEAVRGKGVRAFGARVDVTDPDAVEEFAARTYQDLGGCHLLCNNAGVLVVGSAHERTLGDWDFLIGVNIRGPIHGIRSFVPRMIQAGGESHIVNTCSCNSLFTVPRNGPYQMTKFALLGLTESLRVDLADKGIGVSALCPGGTRTGILRSERNRPASAGPGARPSREDLSVMMEAGDPANAEMIEPSRVADITLEAVRRNEPYIITHPASKPLVEARVTAILKAYDDALARDGLA